MQKNQHNDKNIQLVLRLASAVLIVGGLAGAWVGVYKHFNPDLPYATARKFSKDPMALTRDVQINGVNLTVPVPYFKSGHIPTEDVDEDILLQVMYPGLEPIKENPDEVFKRGEWYRNVMILISDASKKRDAKGLYESLTQHFRATDFVRVEYGLNAYTQPNEVKGADDIWVEGQPDTTKSFIVCMKQYSETTHPQCSHYIWDSKFQFLISYDKKLLPHWKEIKDQTLTLIASFRSKKPSESSTKNNPKGD